MTPIRVDAANPGAMTGRGNSTWLIDGREPALVDAGVGAPEHLAAIARALGGRPLAHVLITHGHADHVSGVPALQERWPGLTAWKWLGAESESERKWRTLREGQTVAAGDSELRVVRTPGHAPDHVCFWHEGSRALFSGDMVVPGSTVMIPASRGGNLREYLSSLERLRALAPSRLYPGHGDAIDHPIAIVDEYLAHRAMRDRQVRSCLKDGVTAIDAIVARIYPDLAPALTAAARETVLAHLQKIAEDDRSAAIHSSR